MNRAYFGLSHENAGRRPAKAVPSGRSVTDLGTLTAWSAPIESALLVHQKCGARGLLRGAAAGDSRHANPNELAGRSRSKSRRARVGNARV
jgi:hypothetical protein